MQWPMSHLHIVQFFCLSPYPALVVPAQQRGRSQYGARDKKIELCTRSFVQNDDRQWNVERSRIQFVCRSDHCRTNQIANSEGSGREKRISTQEQEKTFLFLFLSIRDAFVIVADDATRGL